MHDRRGEDEGVKEKKVLIAAMMLAQPLGWFEPQNAPGLPPFSSYSPFP